MAYARSNIKNSARQVCMQCGLRIKLLGDHKSIALFLGETSAQRRGYRCMNCGGIACIECSERGCHCACMGNAWVALPYLDGTQEKNGHIRH